MPLKKVTLIFLILAIFLGILVRTYKITTLPFPPNGDELFFGYYGWSLLHFGTDEYGTFLPLNFPSIGDYKYPALAYLNILPAIFFGLSDITARFWTVISGIVLIPLIYFLVLKLFDEKLIALAAAWIIALSPWDIIVSRLGYENHPALTLTSAGLLFLLYIRKRPKLFFILSLILFIISSFTYATQRIFIPLILLTMLLLSLPKSSIFSNLKKPTLLTFIILSSLITLSLLSWQNRGRAEQVVWTGLDAKQENRLEELFIESRISPIKIPSLLTHIFHNPFRVGLEDFLYRYTNHFSPKFLFFEGEAATEKIPDSGVLPLILIVFFPLGLLTLLNYKNRNYSLFILTWLLLAPIPSALTLGEPHINRASMMIPAITIISAYGFWRFLSFFPQKNEITIGTFIFFLFIFNSFYGLNQIFVHKSVSKPWVSEQVNKQMVKEVFALKSNYQAVAIPKDEYIFFLFYGKISPQEFLSRSSVKPATRGDSWERVERLDNIYFKMAYDCPKGGKLNVLYVCSGPNIPQNSKVLKIIRYLDGVPAYTFIQFIPISKMPSTLPQLPDGLKYMVDLEKSPQTKDGLIEEKDTRLW